MLNLANQLKKFPWTICLDYSTFDALNNHFYRREFDFEFFRAMEKKGILDTTELGLTKKFLANT